MGPATCALISILPLVPFSNLLVFLLGLLPRNRAPPLKDEADHTEPSTGGSPASVGCVFCLSDIEEGEEVTDLRCNHLFHRRCLDRWMFAKPRATCPLCRDALLPGENMAATANAGGGGGAHIEDEVEGQPAVAWLFAHYYLPWCIDRTRGAFFCCKDNQE